ncbi:MAG: helix-turn-helix transcriptional regulator, partial [Pseudomonadota bacterium]
MTTARLAKLQEHRREIGITASRLAEVSGIHRNTIGKIDKGGRVRIGIVHKLLESLHERSPPYYKPILAAEAQALGLDLTALSEGEQKTEDLL